MQCVLQCVAVCDTSNLALHHQAVQLSTWMARAPGLAVDGDKTTCSSTSTDNYYYYSELSTDPWLAVDLGQAKYINYVVITTADC